MTLDELAVLFALSAGRKLKRTDDAMLELLARDGLVTILGRVSSVSERGMAFVRHVQGLPLPSGGWSMEPHGPSYAGGIRFVGQEYRDGALQVDDDGPPPPPPQKVKRVFASDEDKKAEALSMMERGYGLGEIKAELELTGADMQDYFQADV